MIDIKFFTDVRGGGGARVEQGVLSVQENEKITRTAILK